MTESLGHDCEVLLAQAAWVRARARHLVADAHTADDLAQDALAAALVRPPPRDRSLRGWLAGIVRNLVRQDRRSAQRRVAREREVARERGDRSSAQLLEGLDAHRAVVDAVARLREPYRAAILMRYFESLSPAAIATRTGVPLDERRQPIASAELAVPLPFGLRSRFDAILDSASSVERKTRTDSEGRFELRDVPLFAGAKLETTHAAHLGDERELPLFDELALEFVLSSARAEGTRLVGKIVDPQGDPVEGAWVALGASSTKSGPAGDFALDLESADGDPSRSGASRALPLRAVKAGYLPAELARPISRAWPDPLILRLGGPPLALAGRVVDPDGKPVARAEVWTDEEMHFGYIAIESGEMSMQAGASIEGILRGDPWAWRAKSDQDGRFELEGLLERSYRVHALDRKRLLVTTANFEAGSSGVEIRLPREDLYERVTGRVTSLSEDPIEGAEVVLERSAAGTQEREIDRLESTAATTDADGLFAFERVSRSVCAVNVRGLDFGLTGFRKPIGPQDDVENLELAGPMRVHVQIDVGRDARFDEVALLDVRGDKLELSIHHGESSYVMSEIPVQEGRTEPFSVSELAETLVLYEQDVEVRRMPLELARGELNTIRL